MATNISSVTDTVAGAVPTPTAGAANMEFAWTADAVLEVKNAQGVTGCVVTIRTPADVDSNVVAEKTVTVAAGTSKRIGPFKSEIYRQSTGLVLVDLDETTSITLGVTRTPRNA